MQKLPHEVIFDLLAKQHLEIDRLTFAVDVVRANTPLKELQDKLYLASSLAEAYEKAHASVLAAEELAQRAVLPPAVTAPGTAPRAKPTRAYAARGRRSNIDTVILQGLKDHGPITGIALLKQLRTNYALSCSTSAYYRMLKLLIKRKYVTHTQGAKRLYTATDRGLAVLERTPTLPGIDATSAKTPDKRAAKYKLNNVLRSSATEIRDSILNANRPPNTYRDRIVHALHKNGPTLRSEMSGIAEFGLDITSGAYNVALTRLVREGVVTATRVDGRHVQYALI